MSTVESAYLIGGDTGGSEYSTTIARFWDNEWALVGDLRTGRYKHRSIMVGNRAYIIGGENEK